MISLISAELFLKFNVFFNGVCNSIIKLRKKCETLETVYLTSKTVSD